MSQLDQMRAWLPTMARTGCGKPRSNWGSARALASRTTMAPTLFRRRMSSRLGSREIVIPGSAEPDHPLAICQAFNQLGTHRMIRCVFWSHVTTPTRPPFTRSNWAGATTPGLSVVAMCEGYAFWASLPGITAPRQATAQHQSRCLSCARACARCAGTAPAAGYSAGENTALFSGTAAKAYGLTLWVAPHVAPKLPAPFGCGTAWL
jgi:hypothetical protein